MGTSRRRPGPMTNHPQCCLVWLSSYIHAVLGHHATHLYRPPAHVDRYLGSRGRELVEAVVGELDADEREVLVVAREDVCIRPRDHRLDTWMGCRISSVTRLPTSTHLDWRSFGAIPQPFSAVTACSRDDPHPNPRPATTAVTSQMTAIALAPRGLPSMILDSCCTLGTTCLCCNRRRPSV
jgi:hypothetical protein